MRKIIALLCLVALLAAGLMMLPSCTRDDGTGKTFAFALAESPQQLDPATAQSPDELLIINNIFEGLVRQNTEGRITAGVAARWYTSSDGLVYTFHFGRLNHWALNAQARALLGDRAGDFDTQVTAYDFAFGLTRALLPETNAPGAAALYAIQNAQAVHEGRQSPGTLGIEVIDRFTLQITLEQPNTQFLYALTQSVAMPCNQEFFEATQGRYGLTGAHMLTNGPFYINRWTENHLRLRQNEGYGGFVAPFSVNLHVQPSHAARLNTLGHDGGLDAAIVPAEFAEHIPQSAQVTRLYNATQVLLLGMGNARLRQAMTAALDAAEFNQDARGLLPASVQVGGEALYTLAPSPPPTGGDRAQELFAQAGVDRVTLTFICAPEYELLARQMLQYWQSAFGMAVTVNLEVIDQPQQLSQRLQSGNFDLAITTMQATSSFAVQTLEDWAGQLGHNSARLRELLQTARTQTDPPDIAETLRAAEQNLLRSGVVYPLAPQASLLVVAQGVEGFSASPVGDRVFFAEMLK